ncbi:MAG TPA: outer membrane protein assembly factor BamD [Candidatus Acidoferrales bacterium]|nr:outer membrane protein assembly factor BamD [Candidatus Acidoferrales bacterium]
MKSISKRPSFWLTAAVLVSLIPAGCLFSGHKKTAAKTPDANAEPDKILYDRALNDYNHGRYTESRLSLQTLINSYPDSEYLAKAKLAVADSYYKEGGTEGLTQAVAEYKDFETFFPFLEEAAYAQMQIGMAHYRMMEKPDRDATQARLAEQEFQTFLLKYPKSPLVPQAEQRLRDVQEVIGGGDFEVAHFYYVKGDYRAAASRLVEVANRYPLFSQADRARWMLGDIYRRAASGSKNERERARWRSLADDEYAELVKEYPMSSLAAQAKQRLSEDSAKIPPPDPDALARAKYEEKFAHDHPGLVHRAMGVMKSAPDVSMAAHTGAPDLNPPENLGGPQDVTSASGLGSDTTGTGSSQGNMNIQTVSPESSTPPPASVPPPADPPSTSGTSSNTVTSTPPATEGAPPSTNTAPPTTNGSGTSSNTAASDAGTSANTAATASDQQSAPDAQKPHKTKADKSKESTSKRKRGLKKLIPW